MKEDPVEAAIERGNAAAAVIVKHRDALFPHILVLLRAIGPIHTRACVAGAVEAAIVAVENERRAAVIPFSEGPK